MAMDALRISMSMNYSSNRDNLQYIDTKPVNDEKRYILGKINQHTLGITFRVDYNITPEFSIQYYGSPFASVGKYSDFKSVVSPRAEGYESRYSILHSVLNENNYEVTENNSPGSYSFANPDFNFSQFRSNLVLRWEYLPGSQVYLVWSHERTHYVTPGSDSVSDAINILKDIYPRSIFLVKFNYWFTI